VKQLRLLDKEINILEAALDVYRSMLLNNTDKKELVANRLLTISDIRRVIERANTLGA
jgi:hypothetical protein